MAARTPNLSKVMGPHGIHHPENSWTTAILYLIRTHFMNFCCLNLGYHPFQIAFNKQNMLPWRFFIWPIIALFPYQVLCQFVNPPDSSSASSIGSPSYTVGQLLPLSWTSTFSYISIVLWGTDSQNSYQLVGGFDWENPLSVLR